jgi:antirestriction protein ArdC
MSTQHSLLSVHGVLLSHLERRRLPDLSGLPRGSIVRRARALVGACQVELVTGGRQPCYDPDGGDGGVIYMPSPGFYVLARLIKRPKRYAIDTLHELVHATGHRSRLARPRHVHWGDLTYQREELCAELGAVLCAADLGMKAWVLPNARYLTSWLQGLDNPKLELEMAMSRANQAAGYIVAVARRNLSRGLR